MIAADTSVIVAIAKREPGHERYGALMAEQAAVIGTPSLVETKMALSSFLRPQGIDALLADLVGSGGLQPVPFTLEMVDAAIAAFRLYGKGQGHPAQLNLGDCLSYAVAKVLGIPLLFQGDDFSRTDIEPAWRP